jgi:hypothetical protein
MNAPLAQCTPSDKFTYGKIKTPHGAGLKAFETVRHRLWFNREINPGNALLSRYLSKTTIAAEGLHCRVRNGNGF